MILRGKVFTLLRESVCYGNDTRYNDTVAAIVGAALGALHGKRAIPSRWLTGLLGRTTEDDDGFVFDLIEQARTKWGTPAAA